MAPDNDLKAEQRTERLTTATRDLADTRAHLQRWLRERIPGASISELESPAANGLSSETLLFEAAWDGSDGTNTAGFAARVAPDPANLPVFPSYDLHAQFRLLEIIGAIGTVPVPKVWWYEPDPAALGAPFFVMARVAGRVPPDVMPYNFGSWLSEAPPAEQRLLQDATVEVLARIHAFDTPVEQFSFLRSPGDSPLRAHVDAQRTYYEWVAADTPIPLLEQCFDWLEEHWPDTESDTVLSWGDARIGNVLYDGFLPAAVLDWEMASLAPPEVDLAWMIFLHRFFEDIAISYELPGMPGFMRREDVVATYEAASGRTVRDLDWFLMYAALRHGVVMSRTQQRQIHFGEAAMPDDINDLIFHRASLEKMLAGTYWEAVS